MTEPGSGYSSPPKVSLKGMEQLHLKATVHFEKDLKKNGSIDTVEVVIPNARKLDS